ncbi:helix-turn-helix domain-containing protein [Streptomyces diastatochromogenes]|nr:helix-turn-helix domain-containing protein [Streptomyces diastatochromogenes]
MAAGPEVRHRPGDLARTTGLARSTVDRVTTTLVRLGVLRAEGRDLLLAPRAAELGNAYLASCGLPELLGPHAVALADALDESVSVAVPDGDGVRFLAQATRRRAMAISFRTGDLLPAERCAPGALFAARWDAADHERWRERRTKDPLDTGFPPCRPGRPLPPTRSRPSSSTGCGGPRGRMRRGRPADRAGLLAVALPVRGPDGAVVCAVSVVSHTSRHSAASLTEQALPPLRRAVAAMERALAEPGRRRPRRPPDRRPPRERAQEELGSGFLQSLARGLDVLRAFGSVRGPSGSPNSPG